MSEYAKEIERLTVGGVDVGATLADLQARIERLEQLIAQSQPKSPPAKKETSR